MKRSTAVAAALWLLATPAAASAATLRTGTDGQLVYLAAARESNDLTVREVFDGEYPWSRTLGISDVVPVSPMAGDACMAGTPLVCEMRSTDAYLGNRADRARVVVYAFGTSRVWGEDGDDTVYAGGGEAYAYGGGGDDTVGAGAQGAAVGYGGPGDDLVTSFQGAFTILHGEAGADTLQASGMNTSAFGGDGEDVLELSGRGRADGGRNDDRIDAGGSAWRIDGGPGNDTITVTSDGVDTVTCGSGRDKVTAGLDDVIAADCETVSRS
jgi:Ca2+-binding RTX toxin-like protein